MFFSILLLTLLLPTIGVSAQAIPQELVNGLKWRLIGPFRGGRAVSVAGVLVVPANLAIVGSHSTNGVAAIHSGWRL